MVAPTAQVPARKLLAAKIGVLVRAGPHPLVQTVTDGDDVPEASTAVRRTAPLVKQPRARIGAFRHPPFLWRTLFCSTVSVASAVATRRCVSAGASGFTG